MSLDELRIEPKGADERRALAICFVLNVGLAATLAVGGLLADSSGLIANAVDNASDAGVYAVSYYAVGRNPHWKIRAAQISGVMLLVLCAGILVDVIRRLLSGSDPISGVMMALTVIAALVNLLSLRVLRRIHQPDVNVRAAWTFSINDFVSNLGVLVAAILVAWSGRSWPDLVVGGAIVVVVAKGGIEILRDAGGTHRAAHADGS